MKLDIPINKPIHSIHPKVWKTELDRNTLKLDYVAFRNLQHFKNYVAKLTQKDDMRCGVSYKQAVDDLLKNKSQYDKDEYELIRNKVRSNLLKRGLITADIYESYKYDIDGVAVDVAKIVEEDPECFITPSNNSQRYFYELYINISYPGSVTDAEVRKSMCKLLATIEELERQHIYIKVTIVDVSLNVDIDSTKNLMFVLPVFSHRDIKSIEVMSAVLNERLLRKFSFAMSEDIYKDKLSSGYGTPLRLSNTITPVDLNEIDLFQEIFNKVITPGER